jgi:hypothetical protein
MVMKPDETWLPCGNYCRLNLVTMPDFYTEKKFDEVVRHLHLVTQDQFSLVSKKDSGIHEENCNKNIEVFQQTFTNVEKD